MSDLSLSWIWIGKSLKGFLKISAIYSYARRLAAQPPRFSAVGWSRLVRAADVDTE